MTKTRRKWHSPEQIVKKLRDAESMLNAGKGLAAVIHLLEIAEATFHRWLTQHDERLNQPVLS